MAQIYKIRYNIAVKQIKNMINILALISIFMQYEIIIFYQALTKYDMTDSLALQSE